MTRRLPGGAIKRVDFLSGVVGLTTKDIVHRAVELKVPRIGRLRVMHPVDVLDSRIQNLHLLPEKRTASGIAQGRLAVEVARAFVRAEISARGERAGLNLLERIADIADDIAAVRVFLLYGIDPLHAVPLDDFRATGALHRVRWPQIVSEVEARRERLRKLTTRTAKSVRRRQPP